MTSSNTISYIDTNADDLRGKTFVAPYLVVGMCCQRPTLWPARISVAEVERVNIGRGDALLFIRGTTDGEASVDVAIHDSWMSTTHALMSRTLESWYIEDAGSKNGTYVNGERIEKVRLADGDLIETGSTITLFRCRAERRVGDPVDIDLSNAETLTPLSTLNVDLHRQFEMMRKIAPTKAPVMVLGESGSGKELIARQVHELSGRKGPFTAVNCGAIPTGLVESELFGHRKGAFSGADTNHKGLVRAAHKGTLLLDEIAELPPASQVALLRVLQEGEVVPVGDTKAIKVDVRVVAATHQDLADRQKDGRFRTDLFARLAGFTVNLPSLTDRREDISLLVATLLEKHAGSELDRVRFTRSAGRALFEYPWPMNIRELEHSLRAAIAIAEDGEITIEALPKAMRERNPNAPAPRPVETDGLSHELQELLREHAGNVSEVARALGRSRPWVHRMLKRCNISASDFRK